MAKTKTVQASLIEFCFFSANPSWLGSSAPIGDIRGYIFSPAAQRPWLAKKLFAGKPTTLTEPDDLPSAAAQSNLLGADHPPPICRVVCLSRGLL